MSKSYLIIPLFLVLAVPTAYAQTGTSTRSNTYRVDKEAQLEAKRAEMDAKRETKRAEAELKRASSTVKRIELQQDTAKRKVEKTAQVITATIGRLEGIIARIESRIAKVKERGGSVSESEKFVATAKVNLSDAKAAVAAFTSLDLSGDKAKDNFEQVRTAAAEAREIIRTAHQNLMMAVRSLSSVEIDATASSTPATQ